MGIERVSEVKLPEHWIGALQLVAQASGGDHSHSSAFDRLDLCLISIEQSSAMIVFGPPDPVTGMDRQPLLLEERKAIVLRTGTDPARPKGSCLTLAIDERSEEHTSELQSLMRISYAVFCLKKKKSQIHY